MLKDLLRQKIIEKVLKIKKYYEEWRFSFFKDLEITIDKTPSNLVDKVRVQNYIENEHYKQQYNPDLKCYYIYPLITPFLTISKIIKKQCQLPFTLPRQ